MADRSKLLVDQTREVRLPPSSVVPSAPPPCATMDLERQDLKQCRICLECDDRDELIQPCRCSGTCKWVHRSCLNSWRVRGANVRAFTHCPNCGFAYLMTLIRAPTEVEQQVRKRRRRLLRKAVGNFVLSALTLQLILCLLAMVVRAIDQQESLVVFFNISVYDGKPPGQGDFMDAMRHHKATYYLTAVILSLFAIGIWSTVAWCGQTPLCNCVTCHECQVCPDDPCAQYYVSRECGECCGDCCRMCEPQGGGCPQCECPNPRSCGECCSDCNCNPANGTMAMESLIALVLIVIVTFAMIGLFVAMFMVVSWIQRVIQRYYQLHEVRVLTQEYVVQDLSKLQPSAGITCPSSGLSFVANGGVPQEQSRDGFTAAPAIDLVPSAPAGTYTFDFTYTPTTTSAVQQSLNMDLQAVYGYQAN